MKKEKEPHTQSHEKHIRKFFAIVSLYLILYHLICTIAKSDDTTKGNRL